MSSGFSDDSSMDEETSNGLIVLKTYGNRGPGLPDVVLACGSVVDFRAGSSSSGGGIGAIVNAANEGCLGGGGVDGAVTEAGGPNLARDRRALPVLGGATTRKRKSANRSSSGSAGNEARDEQKIAAVLSKKQEPPPPPSDVAGEEHKKEKASAGKNDETNAAAETSNTDAEETDEAARKDLSMNETQLEKQDDATTEAEKSQSIEAGAKSDDDSKPAAKENGAPDGEMQIAENKEEKFAAAAAADDDDPKVEKKENGEKGESTENKEAQSAAAAAAVADPKTEEKESGGKEEEHPKGADKIVDPAEKKNNGDDASVNMLDSDDDDDDLFASGPRCRTGSAVITGPGEYGDLRVPFVIHAVGPNFWEWLGREDEAFARLESAYSDSLQLAAEHGIAEVAFSLLSAGVFRGRQSMGRVLMHGLKAVGEWRPPAVVVAREAEETGEWTEIAHGSQESSLKKVFFCAFTEKECMILLKAGRYVFERDANE